MRKIRLLWVSEAAVVNTGFGVVGANILPKLVDTGRFEVVQLGLAYQGDAPEEEKKYNFPIMKCRGTADDQFGQQTLAEVCEKFVPEIVVSFGDEWMVSYVVNTFQKPTGEKFKVFPEQLRNRFKWVPLVPLDGSPIPKKWMFTFEQADLTLVPSYFAKSEIDRHNASLPVQVIYHGVNTEVFKPPNEEMRKKAREIYGFGEDTFIIGVVGRNQRRKLYPQLFRALKEVVKTHSHVRLYVHAIAQDQGWDLPELATQIGVMDNIIWNTEITNAARGVSTELLAQLYQGMDLFCLPSAGEGFGIPILEAMSCGVPVLTPDCSANGELVKRSMAGELIKCEERDCLWLDGDNNVKRPIANVEDMTRKIIKMVENKDLREAYGKKGREFALQYDWSIIADQVDKALTNLIFPEDGRFVHVIDV